MLAFWFLIGLLVIGGGLYVLRYRRRTAALRRLASQRGWTYRYAVYATFTRAMKTPPFDAGGRRAVRHLIEGTCNGRTFRAFDYWLTTGQVSEHWGIVTTSIPAHLPLVCIDHRHVSRHPSAGALASGSEVATESEELNRDVRITTDDAKTASNILAPQVVALLLDHGNLFEHVRLSHDTAVSMGSEIATSTDVAERIEALCALVDAIPSFVWKDHPPVGVEGARGVDPT